MTYSFDITTALVADRQHTLREEAHHHRLGRIARLGRRRGAARRAAVVQGGSADAVTGPRLVPARTTDANTQERTAA